MFLVGDSFKFVPYNWILIQKKKKERNNYLIDLKISPGNIKTPQVSKGLLYLTYEGM